MLLPNVTLFVTPTGCNNLDDLISDFQSRLDDFHGDSSALFLYNAFVTEQVAFGVHAGCSGIEVEGLSLISLSAETVLGFSESESLEPTS